MKLDPIELVIVLRAYCTQFDIVLLFHDLLKFGLCWKLKVKFAVRALLSEHIELVEIRSDCRFQWLQELRVEFETNR